MWMMVVHIDIVINHSLARHINGHLLYFPSASIFKVLQCRSKLVKMLSECQTAWIGMRCRVTRHLIWIQAGCILHFGCDWQAKG